MLQLPGSDAAAALEKPRSDVVFEHAGANS